MAANPGTPDEDKGGSKPQQAARGAVALATPADLVWLERDIWRVNLPPGWSVED